MPPIAAAYTHAILSSGSQSEDTGKAIVKPIVHKIRLQPCGLDYRNVVTELGHYYGCTSRFNTESNGARPQTILPPSSRGLEPAFICWFFFILIARTMTKTI